MYSAQLVLHHRGVSEVPMGEDVLMSFAFFLNAVRNKSLK